MMKIVAIFTAVLILIDVLYSFGLLFWDFWQAGLSYGEVELPYALRYVINNLLYQITQVMLAIFLMLFASNSK